MSTKEFNVPDDISSILTFPIASSFSSDLLSSCDRLDSLVSIEQTESEQIRGFSSESLQKISKLYTRSKSISLLHKQLLHVSDFPRLLEEFQQMSSGVGEEMSDSAVEALRVRLEAFDSISAALSGAPGLAAGRAALAEAAGSLQGRLVAAVFDRRESTRAAATLLPLLAAACGRGASRAEAAGVTRGLEVRLAKILSDALARSARLGRFGRAFTVDEADGSSAYTFIFEEAVEAGADAAAEFRRLGRGPLAAALEPVDWTDAATALRKFNHQAVEGLLKFFGVDPPVFLAEELALVLGMPGPGTPAAPAAPLEADAAMTELAGVAAVLLRATESQSQASLTDAVSQEFRALHCETTALLTQLEQKLAKKWLVSLASHNSTLWAVQAAHRFPRLISAVARESLEAASAAGLGGSLEVPSTCEWVHLFFRQLRRAVGRLLRAGDTVAAARFLGFVSDDLISSRLRGLLAALRDQIAAPAHFGPDALHFETVGFPPGLRQRVESFLAAAETESMKVLSPLNFAFAVWAHLAQTAEDYTSRLLEELTPKIDAKHQHTEIPPSQLSDSHSQLTDTPSQAQSHRFDCPLPLRTDIPAWTAALETLRSACTSLSTLKKTTLSDFARRVLDPQKRDDSLRVFSQRLESHYVLFEFYLPEECFMVYRDTSCVEVLRGVRRLALSKTFNPSTAAAFKEDFEPLKSILAEGLESFAELGELSIVLELISAEDKETFEHLSSFSEKEVSEDTLKAAKNCRPDLW